MLPRPAWRASVLPLAATLALVAGCAADPGPGTPSAPSAAPAAAVTSAPADGPSEPARIVCEEEAQEDLEAVLGVTAAQVGPAAYADHTSTCRYRYPNGFFDLTVRDLADAPATTAAFTALAAQRGRVRDLPLHGAQAFVDTEGSVIMRKDTQVLLVDVAGLPQRFGKPAISRSDAALLITNTILGCWT